MIAVPAISRTDRNQLKKQLNPPGTVVDSAHPEVSIWFLKWDELVFLPSWEFCLSSSSRYFHCFSSAFVVWTSPFRQAFGLWPYEISSVLSNRTSKMRSLRIFVFVGVACLVCTPFLITRSHAERSGGSKAKIPDLTRERW